MIYIYIYHFGSSWRVSSLPDYYKQDLGGWSKVQITFHRSRVQVTAPSINDQTKQVPLDLIEHFVKRKSVRRQFNAVHLSVSW